MNFYAHSFRASLLLIAVFALANAAMAQTPAPSPEQGIPLAELVTRVEQVKQPLREITRRSSAKAAQEVLAGQLLTVEEHVKAQSEQLTERLTAMTSLYELRELERGWNLHQEQIRRWQKSLADQLTQAESDLRWLRGEQDKWASTFDQVSDTDLLEGVFDRVRSVLAELQAVQPLAQEHANRLLALQDRVSQLDLLIATRLDNLASARQQFQSTLLTRDSRPLWAAFSTSNNDQIVAAAPEETHNKSFVHELAVARESFNAQKNSFVLLAILFVVSLLLNIALAKRIDPLTAGDPDLHQSAAILRRPVSAALLVALLAQLWLSPMSASVINGIVALLFLIPFLLLVRSLFEPPVWMRIPFFTLAILHLSDQVRFLADIDPLIERLVFLSETAVALSVIFWMFRPNRFDLLPVQPLALRWLRRALFVMAALLAISFLANVLGFVTLAKVLGEGALRSIYLGGLLYGAARVICVGMALLVRTNRAQISVFVQLHRDDIVKWISRGAYFLAGVLWLIGSLELFTVREQFLALLDRVFEASVGFRSLRVSIGDVVSFALVVTLAYYLSKVVKFVLQEDVLTRMPLKRGVPQAMATAAQYLLLIAGFVLAVTAAGFDLDRLTLLTGAFGVGIGFGLQNVVNNFVSGLILLFERPVQVGDSVQVGSVSGDITRIGIRSSTIRTYQGAEVIVPNGKLISDEVTNWTLTTQIRRVEIPVGVAYGSEPSNVTELLLNVAQSNPEILSEPAPQVLFTGFGDNALQFELRFWTAIQVHPVVRSQMVMAILRALETAGIEIPFPQRDLRVKLDDEVIERLVARQGKNQVE